MNSRSVSAVPVLDLYSLNECRLVGAAADPGGRSGCGHRLVPHDVYVEILDDAGRPVPEGRARGDHPDLRAQPASCRCCAIAPGTSRVSNAGGARPLLEDLEGRAPVVFLDAAGRAVNSIDVSYLLKPFPLARFALHQAADRSLRLSVQGPAADQELMREVLAKLFGDLPLEIASSSRSRPAPANSCPTRRTSRTPGAKRARLPRLHVPGIHASGEPSGGLRRTWRPRRATPPAGENE